MMKEFVYIATFWRISLQVSGYFLINDFRSNLRESSVTKNYFEFIFSTRFLSEINESFEKK